MMLKIILEVKSFKKNSETRTNHVMNPDGKECVLGCCGCI